MFFLIVKKKTKTNFWVSLQSNKILAGLIQNINLENWLFIILGFSYYSKINSEKMYN